MVKAKKRKTVRQSQTTRQRLDRSTSRGNRLRGLDAVRGLAIVLMIVDHVAGILFDLPIEVDNVRMLTRLSMPLFSVLMGYFLAAPKKSIGIVFSNWLWPRWSSIWCFSTCMAS